MSIDVTSNRNFFDSPLFFSVWMIGIALIKNNETRLVKQIQLS